VSARPPLTTRAALAAIRLYRTHVSPRKGFSCAYRKHMGRASCSTLGERAIRRHGLIGGAGILRLRLACCGDAYRRAHPPRAVPQRQRGSCDAPCDIPCDGSELSKAGDVCSCLDCGSCDGSRKDRRQRR
jgi:putative component of membrane protein insertase Oxa1/YidC/SpoIIIJ protein YidD